MKASWLLGMWLTWSLSHDASVALFVAVLQSLTESGITYRLMLLGRAVPVVNARLPLTEANVVLEDCGRGRGPS